jgi:hypothetical protein
VFELAHESHHERISALELFFLFCDAVTIYSVATVDLIYEATIIKFLD